MRARIHHSRWLVALSREAGAGSVVRVSRYRPTCGSSEQVLVFVKVAGERVVVRVVGERVVVGVVRVVLEVRVRVCLRVKEARRSRAT